MEPPIIGIMENIMNHDDSSLITLPIDLPHTLESDYLITIKPDLNLTQSLQAISMFSEYWELIQSKKYEVCIPEDVIKLINSGEARWDKYDDLYGALIRDVNSGRIIKHIKVKELPTSFREAIHKSTDNIMLAAINKRLSIIQEDVRNIVRGQQNDRMALLSSGKELLRQALWTINPDLKLKIEIQGISLIEEGRQKLLFELDEYLKEFERLSNDPSWIVSLTESITNPKIEKAKRAFFLVEALLTATVINYSFYFRLREFQSARASLIPVLKLLQRLIKCGNTIERFIPYNKSYPSDDILSKHIPDLINELQSRTPLMLGYTGDNNGHLQNM